MEGSGNTAEDWEIFDVLTQSSDMTDRPAPGDTMTHDMNTTLRSELAALQYKRDRLLAETI
ncbi:hypothetical protein LSTR_LSTR013287 [Laodelphax striatellus]|uniref:Uncharacterized protein n=1 Tax=Laodelphax striatellus TaxID=195883 RepID=A0A482X4C1_LAOST|nr:hypothetical protein LSTR_LSTR013287 [Laodelphax striatellus]